MTTFLSQRLPLLRRQRNLSQRQLAGQLGVEVGFIQGLESGDVVPSLYVTRILANALNVSVASLLSSDDSSWIPSRSHRYYSVFISYGGPDESFARALYESFLRVGIHTFFFPETARPGQRLHRTMSQGVNEYDRILLLCSRASLQRPGVLNEIEQVLAREAREGGLELLIPVTIDDYVFSEWSPTRGDLAFQLRDRVVADFRNIAPGSSEFVLRLNQILKALETIEGVGAIADAIQKQVNPHVTNHSVDADPLPSSRPPLRLMNVASEGLPAWGENTSTTFFGDRMADAFPGVRQLRWFDAKEAIQRLNILLQSPLAFRTVTGGIFDPIWWFRGLRTSSIDEFQSVDATKCLMNHEELVINRIAAFRTDAYYQQFVYVETLGEPSIGIYPYEDEYIEEHLTEFGYAREEYALFGERPITRAEFDDGSAVIDGAVVRTQGAKLRSRYLSRYNFIIAAKFSPYNSKRFDGIAQTFLNRILAGEAQVEDLLEIMVRLPRHRKDGEPVS